MATATNGGMCDVVRDACAKVVSVAGQSSDGPPTMTESVSVRPRGCHDDGPRSSCKNRWPANRTPTICDPNGAAAVGCASDGDGDDGDGRNERWA